MSIRPVDYTSLVPKSLEVTKIKQVENNKFRIQMEQEVIQQDKQVKQNIKKVRDTNKSESLIIDPNKRNKDEKDRDKKRQKKKREEDKVKDDLGGIIDIKI